MDKVDVSGILERAGADADAPEGSQAWSLAQVEAAVAELIEAGKELQRIRREGASHSQHEAAIRAHDAALARVGVPA